MNLYRNWFLASRPWSFSMTAISISVGSALAAIDGPFNWWLFAIALISGVLMHAATNLLNDYHDVKNGVDTVEAATAQYRPHPLVNGELDATQVLWVSYALFTAAALLGLYLAITCGWMIFWIGLVGIIAGITYTAPPIKYKYMAIGELSVFLMWGPLMILGAYYVQRQAFDINALLISLPFGVLVALVLLANNIRDINHDRKRHIKTIATVLGHNSGLRLYFALLVIAYAAIIGLTLSGVLTRWALIIFLTLPIAAKLLQQMIKVLPADADAQTAKLDNAFGILLVVSLIIEGIVQ